MSLTLDREWSKKLKEAGIEGEVSHWWHENLSWAKDKRYARYHVHDDYVPFTPKFSMIAPAPTLEELLAMVKGSYKDLEWFNEEWQFDCRNWDYEAKVFANLDPKIAVAKAKLWQEGEK